MNSRKSRFIDTLDIFVLSSFAFAQPLFDLLSQNASFFVARQSEPLDIILLVLTLCLIVPALLVCVESVISLMGPKAAKVTHSVLVAGLLAIILLPPLKRLGTIPGVGWLIVALLLGTTLSCIYYRLRAKGWSLIFLSPAILIFPALFLFNSPVYKLLFASTPISSIHSKKEAKAPVVMVVFDEFPLTSLMDEKQTVDANLYPNFAELSQNATWYRNATAITEGTLNAVSAILDGMYTKPELRLLPNAADHPFSLFTLLGGSYQFNVVENNTRICPEHLCGNRDRSASLWNRMEELFWDLGVVNAYIVLPSDLTAALPDISNSWKDFRGKQSRSTRSGNFLEEYHDLMKWRDRSTQFKDFVDSISPSSEPALHFLHILLPHAPWEYLPSGKKHTLGTAGAIRGAVGINDTGKDATLWTDDKWAVNQAYQRHLLQVGLVDNLLGFLLERLKDIGLYDPALIVITADHGASFRPHESLRKPSLNNFPDIMAVPLFIKAPYQKEGKIDDRNVETIDILPTIADILNIEMPWKVDGQSALNQSLPEKTQKIIVTEKENRWSFPPLIDKSGLVAQKIKLFGSGKIPDGLYEMGPYRELVGLQVSEMAPANDSQIQFEIDGQNYYQTIDLTAPVIPAHVTGRIVRRRDGTFNPLNLAVAINGKVRAVTETYLLGEQERFAAVVPDSTFRPGSNQVETFLVSNLNGRPALAGIQRMGRDYQWGELIHFGAEGNGKSYRGYGWGAAEQYFTWTNGKQAVLVLPVSPPKSPVTVNLRLGAYLVPGKANRQKVLVSVNQQRVAEWLITKAGFHERSFTLSTESLTGRNRLVITLETPEAISPFSIGSGKDQRELAIAVVWLKLTQNS